MKALEKSPLAPAKFAKLARINGVKLSTVAAAIQHPNTHPERADVMLAVFQPGTTVAGVLTQSLTASTPVEVCRAHLLQRRARALMVNSGNANAFTGKAGRLSCQAITTALARILDIPVNQIFLASTGVIGEPLPAEKITAQLSLLAERLKDNQTDKHWFEAAQAIMTTDTFAKGITVNSHIGGVPVRINGIAKGSGMIAPDMATMLAFFFTDADIPADVLQALMIESNEYSFNAITVDSDTSTSDSNLIFATGAAANPKPHSINDKILTDFRAALSTAMRELALQIVCDGEGASKLIKVAVSGAESNQAAKIIAAAIANSPLVKTAIAGEDANWGRIVMAVGKSGQRVDRDRLQISMGGVLITENGMVVAGYDENRVNAHLKQQQIDIAVALGIGGGEFVMWTCDLTHGYISINADYRS